MAGLLALRPLTEGPQVHKRMAQLRESGGRKRCKLSLHCASGGSGGGIPHVRGIRVVIDVDRVIIDGAKIGEKRDICSALRGVQRTRKESRPHVQIA